MSFPMRMLTSWLINAIVLWVVTALLSKVTYSGVGHLLLAAAVFGVLNTFLKPIARLLTLPLAILTLGIAWFFVSMLMLWLTAAIVPGFAIHGFWTLVLATIIVWAVNLIVDIVIGSWRAERSSRRQHA
jgi:putative membrane protein